MGPAFTRRHLRTRRSQVVTFRGDPLSYNHELGGRRRDHIGDHQQCPNTRCTHGTRTARVVKSVAGQAVSIYPSPVGQGVAGSNPVIPTHRPSPVPQVRGPLRSSHGRSVVCGPVGWDQRGTDPRNAPPTRELSSMWSAFVRCNCRPSDLILDSPKDARRARSSTTPPDHHGAMCGARSHGQASPGHAGQALWQPLVAAVTAGQHGRS